MGRKKETQREQLFSQLVRTRVTEAVYKRLEEIVGNSDARSIGEVARRILSNEKMTFYHKDVSLNAPMEELTNIRKELNAIGVNINQVTRHFNSSDGKQKAFFSLKVLEQYQLIDSKVNQLLIIVSQLAVKWLQ